MARRLKSILSDCIHYGIDYWHYAKALNAHRKMDDSLKYCSSKKHVFLYAGPKMLTQIPNSTYNLCSQGLSRPFAFWFGISIPLHAYIFSHACIHTWVGCTLVWQTLLQGTYSTRSCQALSMVGNKPSKKIPFKFGSPISSYKTVVSE